MKFSSCVSLKLLLSLGMILPFNAFAISNNFFSQLHFGLGRTYLKNDMQIRLVNSPNPGVTNRYRSDNNNNDMTINIGGIIGKKLHVNDYDFQLGLEGNILHYGQVTGTVYPLVNINPNFDRLNFYYRVDSYQLMANFGLTKHLKSRLSTSFNFGVGNSWNRASDYYEGIIPGSTARPMANGFKNNTRSSFAFSLGLSINYTYQKKWIDGWSGVSLC